MVTQASSTPGFYTDRAFQLAHDPTRPRLISIVTPAYNEGQNLVLLHEALIQVLDEQLGCNWEWIIVDDHSADDTFVVASTLTRSDRRVRVMRLARNSGSHTALVCGLGQASGDCAVALAADLQDPPTTLPALLAEWREGAQIVWAVRARRHGERRGTLLLARVYYVLMRYVVGLRQMPNTGADFFLLDRRVLNALKLFRENNVSMLALLAWMGFRQVEVPYEKQARLHGVSGWSLERKLKLAVDSITSFTYLPIRLMSGVGFLVAVLGFAYATVVVVNALNGRPAEGWSSLMVVVLIVGGIQMLMLGVLGEYLWRTLDESRRRPRYIIESTEGRSDQSGGSGQEPT